MSGVNKGSLARVVMLVALVVVLGAAAPVHAVPFNFNPPAGTPPDIAVISQLNMQLFNLGGDNRGLVVTGRPTEFVSQDPECAGGCTIDGVGLGLGQTWDFQMEVLFHGAPSAYIVDSSSFSLTGNVHAGALYDGYHTVEGSVDMFDFVATNTWKFLGSAATDTGGVSGFGFDFIGIQAIGQLPGCAAPGSVPGVNCISTVDDLLAFTLTSGGQGGNLDLFGQFDPGGINDVPEPSTLGLIGAGLVALYWRQRKAG